MRLIADIRKKLGNFNLDVFIDTGDRMTGLLGASGCGKSMTLKCIAGIEKPDSGHIELDGRVLFDSRHGIDIKTRERHVGYLFQSYALFPTMNVRKNILCGLHWEKDSSIREEKYRQVIELLHLEGLEKHKTWQLSGGQAQRTAIARMLVSNPDLLLLDEPFSAIDTFLRNSIQTELSALLESVGKQALLVTHSQKEIRRMCTRLFVMKDGSIIRAGEKDEVFENPGSSDCSILLEE